MEPNEIERQDQISEKTAKKDSLWDIIKFVVIAVIIVLPIRTLVAQPFIVSGSSMFPTFKDNQYLIVDQISYRFNDPVRGDVIIFKFPLDPSKFFIKRVIGLPNEKVVIKDGKVSVFGADGKELKLDEPYLETDKESNDSGVYQLKDDEYFVMGDNRIASSDSRSWGLLPRKNIVGKALIRVLPVNTLSIDPGEYRYNKN
jgi:signal peptidase I